MSDAPTPEDVYRAAAEAAMTAAGHRRVLSDEAWRTLVDNWNATDWFRGAVDAAYAAGREAAAQALRDADWWVNDDRPSAEVMHAFFAHAAEIARGGR